MLHRCDATMASMTDSDKAISFTSPPQLRVVGFTTSSATSEEASENCSTTSHSLQESPLSRLLRSATWPTLRVRLCKTEIPAGLSGGSQCSVHTIHCEQDDSVTPHGRSSSPISIPREYSMKQSTKPTSGTPALMLSHEAAELARGQTEQPSSPPMCCSALSVCSSHCDMDFATACWVLD
ncbi:TPA: hypothetical protein ACH3X2_010835 [Trebouxia sp. C0005]